MNAGQVSSYRAQALISLCDLILYIKSNFKVYLFRNLVPLRITPFAQHGFYCANGIVGNGNQTTI